MSSNDPFSPYVPPIGETVIFGIDGVQTKIAMIKELRAHFQLGLKDAKDLAECLMDLHNFNLNRHFEQMATGVSNLRKQNEQLQTSLDAVQGHEKKIQKLELEIQRLGSQRDALQERFDDLCIRNNTQLDQIDKLLEEVDEHHELRSASFQLLKHFFETTPADEL